MFAITSLWGAWGLNRLSKLVEDYQRQLVRLQRGRGRAVDLGDAGKLTRADVELVHEATFLQAIAGLEALLERMLVAAVCERAASGRLLQPKSEPAFRAVLLRGDDYLAVLPFNRVVEHARYFLAEGEPFNSLPNGERGQLKEAVYVRNAIAHRSKHALSMFREKVPGVDALPPNRRTPGSFLASVFRTAPLQTRHEFYFSTFYRTGGLIAAAWRR